MNQKTKGALLGAGFTLAHLHDMEAMGEDPIKYLLLVCEDGFTPEECYRLSEVNHKRHRQTRESPVSPSIHIANNIPHGEWEDLLIHD